MKPTFSAIIPTTGRITLERSLASIRCPDGDPTHIEVPEDVEIVVVGDVHRGTYLPDLEPVPALCERYGARYVEHDGGSHCWGQQQRNYGMSIAQGEWLSFLQDDDVYTPGAFEKMRQVIKRAGTMPILFKCYLHHGERAVWEYPRVEKGNIDANCIVVPNLPEKLGRWGERYLGDLDFIQETESKWLGSYWSDIVIAEARPG